MTDSFLAYQNPTIVDKRLDSESLTVGLNTVERERIQIAGATDTAIAGVDATNGLDVDVTRLPTGTNAIGRVGHDITGIGDGRKTVTNAGTRETLTAGSTPCKKVTMTALLENTGIVVVGGSTVVAAFGTRRGIPLETAQSITFEIDDLNDVYLDVTVNGEGVSYLYLT